MICHATIHETELNQREDHGIDDLTKLITNITKIFLSDLEFYKQSLNKRLRDNVVFIKIRIYL